MSEQTTDQRGGYREGAGRHGLKPEMKRSEILRSSVEPSIKKYVDAQPGTQSDYLRQLIIDDAAAKGIELVKAPSTKGEVS